MGSGHWPVDGDLLDVFPQLREKAVVDVVNGLEVLEDRLRWRDENPGSFLGRLWAGLTGASERRQQAVDRSAQGVLGGMNEWLHQLQAAGAESDIALARVSDRLQETRQGVMRLQERQQELERLLEEHIEHTENAFLELQQALSVESERSRAWEEVSATDARFRTSRYEVVPPLMRVLLATDGLYWGRFGAFLRLNGLSDGDACKLVDHARNVLANMATDFAKGREFVIVDCWLESLEGASFSPDYRDAMTYLMEGASQENQPLSVSARMRLKRSRHELPRNRPRLVGPAHLSELAMREMLRRIKSEAYYGGGPAR